jgi:hypothetical protein
LPTELIAASPAAAEAPVRNLDGRLHNTGCGQKIPAAATHRKGRHQCQGRKVGRPKGKGRPKLGR